MSIPISPCAEIVGKEKIIFLFAETNRKGGKKLLREENTRRERGDCISLFTTTLAQCVRFIHSEKILYLVLYFSIRYVYLFSVMFSNLMNWR